ncbi:hypothetical protein ACPV5Z_24135, partial [Vibrio mediterranei]|uniref:hypothetical protein n=1 Tax=Vibrio mediterranei TaxID=689 RepID=UPI004068B015
TSRNIPRNVHGCLNGEVSHFGLEFGHRLQPTTKLYFIVYATGQSWQFVIIELLARTEAPVILSVKLYLHIMFFIVYACMCFLSRYITS